MDGCRMGFEADCWRGPAVGYGFDGGAAPTWPAGGRDSGRHVGVARRWIKALQAGLAPTWAAAGRNKGRGLLAWLSGGIRIYRRSGANMDGRQAGFGAACWRCPTVG